MGYGSRAQFESVDEVLLELKSNVKAISQRCSEKVERLHSKQHAAFRTHNLY